MAHISDWWGKGYARGKFSMLRNGIKNETKFCNEQVFPLCVVVLPDFGQYIGMKIFVFQPVYKSSAQFHDTGLIALPSMSEDFLYSKS